jgi:hypothetical protein
VDWFVGAMGEDCFRQEVTDSARFEGAGWLEILELEVDIAGEVSGMLIAVGRQLYHPASLESAADLIRGV